MYMMNLRLMCIVWLSISTVLWPEHVLALSECNDDEVSHYNGFPFEIGPSREPLVFIVPPIPIIHLPQDSLTASELQSYDLIVIDQLSSKIGSKTTRHVLTRPANPLQDGAELSPQNSFTTLRVSDSYEMQDGPSDIQLNNPEIYIGKQGWWSCGADRYVSMEVDYEQGNVNELGFLAFVYMGRTVDDTLTSEIPITISHSRGVVGVGLEAQDAFVNSVTHSFCVAVEVMDITGKRSKRSAAICLDPTDADAPYLSGDGTPSEACSIIPKHAPFRFPLTPCVVLCVGICLRTMRQLLKK